VLGVHPPRIVVLEKAPQTLVAYRADPDRV
jgi:hypothetical protein